MSLTYMLGVDYTQNSVRSLYEHGRNYLLNCSGKSGLTHMQAFPKYATGGLRPQQRKKIKTERVSCLRLLFMIILLHVATDHSLGVPFILPSRSSSRRV